MTWYFFCLKFRVAPACEFVSTWNITTTQLMTIGIFQEKSKQGALRIYFFENKKKKTAKIFRFFTLPLEILCKKGFTLANSVKLCCTPWKFQGKKWRSMGIQHIFSLSMKILYIYIIYIVLFFFIDKRWLLKPLPYGTCCGLFVSK